jgi:hypothetical protein
MLLAPKRSLFVFVWTAVALTMSPFPSHAQASYTLNVGPFTPTPVAPGALATSTVTISPSNGYNYSGLVALSCTVTGGASLSCLGFPMIASGGSGTSMVAVVTSRSTPAGTYSVSVTGVDGSGLGPSNGAQSLPLSVQLTKPSDVFIENSAINGNHDLVNPDPNLIAGGSVIANGVTLRGWLVAHDVVCNPECRINVPDSPDSNGAVQINPARNGGKPYIGFEDVHYYIYLDQDYLADAYGANSSVLNGAWLHGNPIKGPTTSIPVQDVRAYGGPPININSFWLPSTPTQTIHVELNSWHQYRSWICLLGLICKDYAGRGEAPAGWQEKDYGHPLSSGFGFSDNWWPFDPDNPDRLAEQGHPIYLHDGDYVEVQGTLFEDSGLGHGYTDCWSQHYINHGAWLEIHPMDSLKRLNRGFGSVSPSDRDNSLYPVDSLRLIASAREGAKRLVPFAVCFAPPAPSSAITTVCPEKTYGSLDPPSSPRPPTVGLCPPTCPPISLPTSLVPRVQEIIDERFTDLSGPDASGIKYGAIASPSGNPDCVQIKVTTQPEPTLEWQHFKATYIVSWNLPNVPPPPPSLTDSDLYLLPPAFACPRNVTIRDQDPNATIFYTIDGSAPTTASLRYAGPLTVSNSETIAAIAVNNTGQSFVTKVTYTCAPYDYVDIDITTGNDDARSDSQVNATLTAAGTTEKLSWTWTLKPQNGPDPCDTSQSAWNPWTRCHQGFSIVPSIPLFSQFQSITITLGEHPSWFEGWDHWDIQGITVTAYANGKPKILLDLSDPRDQTNLNNCYTSLKHGPGMNTVTYVFGASNPSNGCPQ